ncbi:hypothetical protein J6590_020199 [Homalodisca vitripennis]|nr:hypothetical protein J6590_020199 [Homalodisca vitripennis]
MNMLKYDGCFQTKLITSIKMAVSLSLLMLTLVAAGDDTTSLHSDSTTETSSDSPVTTLPPKPTTTMLPHSKDGDGPVNVTARVGSEIIFDCRIPISGLVVWMYVNPKSNLLSIETVNRISKTTHKTLSFQVPNNYRLKIGSIYHEDEGFYKCSLIP